MQRLPAQPNLSHLKKQAKDLLLQYRSGDTAALARIREGLPSTARKGDPGFTNLRLHQAQWSLAREYGFASWADLKSFVDAYSQPSSGGTLLTWLRLAYAADIAGGENRARPLVAARLLAQSDGLLGEDPYLACAIGEEAILRRATARDPGWLRRPGGPLDLPPLLALAHSTFLQLGAFRARMHACARFLLDSGSDPNQAVGSRWPPASLQAPSTVFLLSPLYGAAGRNHDPELTQMLLDAGADPNDGESLYHALDNLECTRHLLQAGAKTAGTILYRALDLDDVDVLRLLLSFGADPNEPPPGPPTADWGSPLLWAIRRRRSPAQIAALLEAGADPTARTPDGASAHTLAQRFALPEVAGMLSAAGGTEPVSAEERFLAACARADETTARRIKSERPDLHGALSEAQLRILPELAAQGCNAAVMLMIKLGWPIAIRGGDWTASALNLAVFRGDAELTRFLLAHGASWKEEHGHGDNVCGTLSWASCNEPVADGNWPGCAEALIAYGLPAAEADVQGGDGVSIDGRRKWFSDDVTDVLLGARRNSLSAKA
jgi:ankyrin repeat protein